MTPPAPQLTLRRLTSRDWRLYRDLRLRALQDSPDAFGSAYAQEAALTDNDWADRLSRADGSPGELPLVAAVSNEPVGLAWVRMDDDASSTAHLYQMWVAPERRGQGVGRALLQAAIAWAREAGATTVALDVTVGNDEATALYEAAGFVATGVAQTLRPGSALQSRAMFLILPA